MMAAQMPLHKEHPIDVTHPLRANWARARADLDKGSQENGTENALPIA